MNMNFLLLYCALCFVNVVIQTLKSLCTIKCKTFVSACINALAYGIYTYVIFFTNAEGLSLFGKACITAIANFTGVYLANFMFNKLFTKEVSWTVSVSIPSDTVCEVLSALDLSHLIYNYHGENSDNKYVLLTVFCPTKQDSAKLAEILPEGSQYNIIENIKHL